jgi:hypothetical protein
VSKIFCSLCTNVKDRSGYGSSGTEFCFKNRALNPGLPIAGTGAGLRPIGQDPNFAKDFREIYNISVPIHEASMRSNF